jgi:hypothetical protein
MTTVYFRDGNVTAVLETGEALPVTNMIGSDGEECEDFAHAVVVVAGPDKDGMWLTIELDPKEGGNFS